MHHWHQRTIRDYLDGKRPRRFRYKPTALIVAKPERHVHLDDCRERSLTPECA